MVVPNEILDVILIILKEIFEQAQFIFINLWEYKILQTKKTILLKYANKYYYFIVRRQYNILQMFRNL